MKKLWVWFLAGVSLFLIVLWWTLVPNGFTAKLFALGYAFCHQIQSHTIFLGQKALPLCARCTGMYLGTLIGLVGLLKGKKAGGRPDALMLAFLGLLTLFFFIDGINSFFSTFLLHPLLYQPQNSLRLFSGLGIGLVIANVLYPIWNNIFWKDYSTGGAIKSIWQLGIILAIDTVIGLLILSGWNGFYYPVAVASGLVIPFLLTMVYTLLWILIFKKENTFQTWWDGVLFIEIGLITTLIQIGFFDWLRWTLSGSWAGFQI